MHISLAAILFIATLWIVGIFAIRSSDKSTSTDNCGETGIDPLPLDDVAADPPQTTWIYDEDHPAACPLGFMEVNPPQCPVEEPDYHVGALSGHDWDGDELGSGW